MRVVLDTSVLVAAARSRNGASFAILSQLPKNVFQPAVSVSVFAEYRSVLLRPENHPNQSAALVEGFLDVFLSFSHLQEIYFHWRPTLRDPNDDLILELAVAAGCDYIVTHNIRDFAGTDEWGIAVISPGAFLKKIKNQS